MSTGILGRLGTIMAANVNALLDKAEDPAKMVDQYLIDLKRSLAEVKQDTAEVMAIEAQAVRRYDENHEAYVKYTELAKRAAELGHDDDARTFIAKYKELEGNEGRLLQAKNAAGDNARKMREAHNKLASDIRTLESRKAQIKATVAVARTTDKLADIGDPLSRASAVSDKFNSMEEKADRMLDAAQARVVLNEEAGLDAAALAAKKYGGASDSEVEAELRRLKGS
jgi:phage shock protein A